MKLDRLLKLTMALVVVCALAFLIKSNVTFSKESDVDENGNVINRPLEINSDLVQNIYAKLTLLDDVLLNEYYKYAYFKMDSNEKELSSEEKFYITIENLYSNGELELEKEDDHENATINVDRLTDEVNRLFKGENFDAKNLSFSYTPTCGITDYVFTGKDFRFTFNLCKDVKDFTENKLISARKEENFIILRLESFYGIYQKKNKKDKEAEYIIMNYDGEEIIKIPENSIEERLPLIGETYAIDDYDFYFELRGDDYYLSKIARIDAEPLKN